MTGASGRRIAGMRRLWLWRLRLSGASFAVVSGAGVPVMRSAGEAALRRRPPGGVEQVQGKEWPGRRVEERSGRSQARRGDLRRRRRSRSGGNVRPVACLKRTGQRRGRPRGNAGSAGPAWASRSVRWWRLPCRPARQRWLQPGNAAAADEVLASGPAMRGRVEGAARAGRRKTLKFGRRSRRRASTQRSAWRGCGVRAEGRSVGERRRKREGGTAGATAGSTSEGTEM